MARADVVEVLSSYDDTSTGYFDSAQHKSGQAHAANAYDNDPSFRQAQDKLGSGQVRHPDGSLNHKPYTLHHKPWMICEPNEKEGRFLLEEIMRAGNFGRYDDRLEHKSSTIGHAWEKLKRNMRLVKHYPEEVMWEPMFRVYHYIWRKLRLWRF